MRLPNITLCSTNSSEIKKLKTRNIFCLGYDCTVEYGKCRGIFYVGDNGRKWNKTQETLKPLQILNKVYFPHNNILWDPVPLDLFM